MARGSSRSRALSAGATATASRSRLLVYSVASRGPAFVHVRLFGSKPRYLLPAFPLLLPIAGWLAVRRMTWQAGIAAAAAVVAAGYGAVWLLGSGPP